MKNLKQFFMESTLGIVVLKISKPLFLLAKKKDAYNRFLILRFAYGYYYKKKPHKMINKVQMIEKGMFSYQYFNSCFFNEMLADLAFSIYKGSYLYLNIRNSQDDTNIWNMFFKQPFEEEIAKASSIEVMKEYPPYISPFFFSYKNPVERKLWFELYKEYMVFNDEAQKYVDDEYETIIKGKRVLGVLCRGTDYIATKPKNHPVQPEIQDVIKDVKEALKTGRYDYIYLATEEKKIYMQFEEAFKEQVLINKRTYYDEIYYNQKAGSLINSVQFERENDDYLKGMEYLSSLYLLSKCKGLIGGNCGGTLAAFFMNNGKYDYVNIYDLGLYS